jgi:hypothetical protein
MNCKATLGAVILVVFFASSANALSARECSAKYKAARAAGTLKGVSYRQFRRAECGTASSVHIMPGERPASSISSWGAPTPGSSPE